MYLVCTKADRIAGFDAFFEGTDRAAREGVWGATLPCEGAARGDAAARFDHHYAALVDGLRQMSVERLSRRHGGVPAPGVLSFPLEFAALAPVLRAFVAKLFEDNPYQHPPLWRGFYFTSALRGGAADGHAAERVARRFGLDLHPGTGAATPAARAAEDRLDPQGTGDGRAACAGEGRFLKDLYTQRRLRRPRARQAPRQPGAAACACPRLRRRRRRARARPRRLELVVPRQPAARRRGARRPRPGDRACSATAPTSPRASRRSRSCRTASSSSSAAAPRRCRRSASASYQGDALAARLREEYYDGLRQLMLEPVARAIEAFLGEVERNAARLQPMTRAPASAAAPLAAASAGTTTAALYAEASPASVEDAYNALKTYLMLGDRSRLEAAHLNDQLARFWRGWLEAQRGDEVPREQTRPAAPNA